jgi:cation transport ATPase
VSKDAPKSAVELVMERLKQQDAAAEVGTTALTGDQKEAIAAVRREYEAKVAEAEILYHSKLAAVFEVEARQELEANNRRDLSQSASTRDRKIAALRKGD